jgi:DNA-binding transcriptional LysR family regulator
VQGAVLDLTSLELFIRVAELRSFGAAARAAGVQTSSVSRRLAALEGRLGVRLLARDARRVRLTDAGERLLARARNVLVELHAAEVEAGLAGVNPRGLLKVSAPSDLGNLHIAPLLAPLLARHRDLRVELSITDRVVDLGGEGVDVAIRVARKTREPLVFRRVAEVAMAVCGSPAYLSRRGVPGSPGALAGHDLLLLKGVPIDRQWGFAREAGVVCTPRATFDSALALLEAVRAGAGLGNLPMSLASGALGDGTLQEVPGLPAATEGSRGLAVYVVTPAGLPVPKVRVFIDHLTAELPRRLSRSLVSTALGSRT